MMRPVIKLSANKEFVSQWDKTKDRREVQEWKRREANSRWETHFDGISLSNSGSHLGAMEAEKRKRGINKIWFTRFNKVTAGIFHGRSRLRARGLIDTDVTNTLATPKNFTALRFVNPSEQRLCETKDRFGNGLKGDFDPPLCEPFCVSYEKWPA